MKKDEKVSPKSIFVARNLSQFKKLLEKHKTGNSNVAIFHNVVIEEVLINDEQNVFMF